MNDRPFYNCGVLGCLNTTLHRELTFFSLPMNGERRNIWLNLIKRKDLYDKPSADCHICGKHFEKVSILTLPNGKVLIEDSVPKLRLPNIMIKDETIESQTIVETKDECYNKDSDELMIDEVSQAPCTQNETSGLQSTVKSQDVDHDKSSMNKKRYYNNCSVFGCLNTTVTSSGLTFFSLPVNEERRRVWLKLIQREDLNDKSAGHCRVCEDHFDTESILTSPNRKILKKNSFPKLMLPIIRNENKGSQTTIATAHACTQCDIFKISRMSQTPQYLASNTPQIRKLKRELLQSRKRLKTTTTEAETRIMFFKLCDKFLSKKFANIVKSKTKFKLCCLRIKDGAE